MEHGERIAEPEVRNEVEEEDEEEEIEDTHRCGKCGNEFTTLEEYIAHKLHDAKCQVSILTDCQNYQNFFKLPSTKLRRGTLILYPVNTTKTVYMSVSAPGMEAHSGQEVNI